MLLEGLLKIKSLYVCRYTNTLCYAFSYTLCRYALLNAEPRKLFFRAKRYGTCNILFLNNRIVWRVEASGAFKAGLGIGAGMGEPILDARSVFI